MKPDIEKYGWDNFSKIVLFDNIPKDKLGKLEILLISNFNPGYNTSKGGQLGNGLLGDECPWSKVTKNDIIMIRKKYHDGKSQLILAKEYNLSQQHISDIVTGKTRIKDGGKISRIMNNKGEEHRSSILSNEDVVNIRKKYSTGNYTQQKLADIYNVVNGYISQLVRGKKRKEVGGPIKGVDY